MEYHEHTLTRRYTKGAKIGWRTRKPKAVTATENNYKSNDKRVTNNKQVTTVESLTLHQQQIKVTRDLEQRYSKITRGDYGDVYRTTSNCRMQV